MSGCKQSAVKVRVCLCRGVPGFTLLVSAFASAVLFIIRSFYKRMKICSIPFNPVNNMSLEVLLLAAEFIDRRGRQNNYRTVQYMHAIAHVQIA